MTKRHIPEIFQSSATSLPYPDYYFDAVFSWTTGNYVGTGSGTGVGGS